MTNSVLVTGAHGFLGRYVARYFADAGYQVTGIGHGVWNRSEFSKFGLSFWHSADIDLGTLTTYASRPDIIVHCAGSGSVTFSVTHPYQDYVRTASSTAAVLEYIRLCSPQTVMVYPSSAAIYGVTRKLPISECDTPKPASPYGVHKLIAESLCQSYANFGVAVAIVRFFSIYGEGLRKQLLWDACSKVARGEVSFFGTGDELRDWLHVEDAVRLLEMAAKHASATCPIVNGGSGKGVTVREILHMVFQEYGATTPFEFNGEARAGDPPGYQADIANANAWGWQPNINLQDGIKRYVDWFMGIR